MSGEQPRDSDGKFASGGGAGHTSSARRKARDASKRAKASSATAETSGEHEQASKDHKDAASAHHEAAAAHREAATKDPANGEHGAQANQHEASAAKHEGKSEHHGDEAKHAPKEKGASSWLAARLKGAPHLVDKVKEGVHEVGEKALTLEDKALHGDALKDVMGVGTALGGRMVIPPEVALGGLAASVAGEVTGKGEHEGHE